MLYVIKSKKKLTDNFSKLIVIFIGKTGSSEESPDEKYPDEKYPFETKL